MIFEEYLKNILSRSSSSVRMKQEGRVCYLLALPMPVFYRNMAFVCESVCTRMWACVCSLCVRVGFFWQTSRWPQSFSLAKFSSLYSIISLCYGKTLRKTAWWDAKSKDSGIRNSSSWTLALWLTINNTGIHGQATYLWARFFIWKNNVAALWGSFEY